MTQLKKTTLPFSVSRLEVADFQGITHCVIENIPNDKQWIFLTGENGFGKTSVLKAIAKALAGVEAAWLPQSRRLLIEGFQHGQPFSCDANQHALERLNFNLATYGASRFQLNRLDPSEFFNTKYAQKTYSLFNDDGLLINLDRFLIDKERDDANLFQNLKQILLKIIPNLDNFKSEVTLEQKQRVRRMKYYEKSNACDVYAPVSLSELAAGYRGILTLVGDMIQRLTEDSQSLNELQGVVIIDELDAHLHPKYQYDLPNLLSEVFPKIQFIAATHSPMPLLGVNQDTSVVLTVNRTKTHGITVERFDDDIEIQRLSVNALLTSEIFNFGNIFARGATIDRIEPLNNYNQIKEMSHLEKLLELKKAFKAIK